MPIHIPDNRKQISAQTNILEYLNGRVIKNLFILPHITPEESIMYKKITSSDVFSLAGGGYFFLFETNKIIGFARLDTKRSIYAWIEGGITYSNGNYELSGDEYYGLLPADIIDCCHKKYSTPDMCRIIDKKIIGLKIIKLHEASARRYPNERGLLFQLEDDLELCMSAELSCVGFTDIALHNKAEIKEELLDRIEYITVF